MLDEGVMLFDRQTMAIFGTLRLIVGWLRVVAFLALGFASFALQLLAFLGGVTTVAVTLTVVLSFSTLVGTVGVVVSRRLAFLGLLGCGKPF